MTIRVHIGRLIVHDAPAGLDREALARAVSAELIRLLGEAPPGPAVRSDLREADIGARAGTAEGFGAQVAAAVHHAMREPR
ncbi:hypothetical protein [Actinoplanes sp. DH11]|uniref:hypothetical protein n=1 Tax=Actinoplanes sp. DH11 TaxID=2857011 RepID=UPI001E5CF8C4|nr:hypothetical protein [Actinoplanes sp. DH11]